MFGAGQQVMEGKAQARMAKAFAQNLAQHVVVMDDPLGHTRGIQAKVANQGQYREHQQIEDGGFKMMQAKFAAGNRPRQA